MFVRNLKVNIFIFDYRGFGQSSGTPNEKGLYIDTEAAFDYLVGRTDLVNLRDLYVFGTSLGCTTACYIATKR
jgi:fermentation-respiration switch protein FrsA (DUF1100 family)